MKSGPISNLIFTFILLSISGILVGCTKPNVILGGFNFSQSKDEILVNNGNSEARLPEFSKVVIEFRSQVELNQEIEVEIDLGSLNSFLSPPFPDGKARVNLSKSKPSAQVSLYLLAMPTFVLANEFKITLNTGHSSVKLSSSELTVRIEPELPKVENLKINGTAGVSSELAFGNSFILSGQCSGHDTTIFVRKETMSFPGFLTIPLRDSGGNPVKCVNSTWTSEPPDLSALGSGDQNLYVIAVDSAGRESSRLNFSVKTDFVRPIITLDGINQINSHREVNGIAWYTADTDIDHFEIAIGDSTLSPTQVNPNFYTWNAVTPTHIGGSPNYSFDLTGLSLINGNTYFVGLRAYDQVGNMSEVRLTNSFLVNLSQHAYIKAFNSEDYDRFGTSVAIQNDTMVVGSADEQSGHLGVCNQSSYTSLPFLKSDCDNNLSTQSGAAYVYKRTAGLWALQSYIKSPVSRPYDRFGSAVSLDQDRIAVGAPFDDTALNGIVSNFSGLEPLSAMDSGAVYIYKRTSESWSLENIIKASDNSDGKRFGSSLMLKGSYLIVGAPGDGSGSIPGKAYVFRFNNPNWTQVASLTSPDIEPTDFFGQTVALTTTPSVMVAVGSPYESSDYNTVSVGATGIAITNNNKDASGAVYIYKFNSGTGTFSISHRIKATNSDAYDLFGSALDMDATTLAVGASYEGSNQTAITNGPGASSDNSNPGSGAAYVYTFDAGNNSWIQQAYIKPKDPSLNDQFANSLSLSGEYLLVGMYASDDKLKSLANGTSYSSTVTCLLPVPEPECNHGAAYLYRRTGNVWAQANYLKAKNAKPETFFGTALAMDASGNIVVSSPSEMSLSNSIENSSLASDDNSGSEVGAVYIYKK